MQSAAPGDPLDSTNGPQQGNSPKGHFQEGDIQEDTPLEANPQREIINLLDSDGEEEYDADLDSPEQPHANYLKRSSARKAEDSASKKRRTSPNN